MHGFPNKWTTINALVFGDIRFLSDSIEIVKSLMLMSAKTSLYPPLITASAGDKKVKFGTITSEFFGNPKLSKAISNASVPFANPRQNLLLLNLEKFS